MKRILDVDLDFFVWNVVSDRVRTDPRPSAEEHPPWTIDEAIQFLTQCCKLDKPLPGGAVEHHDDVFPLWRQAIETGALTTPFHITHVDGHADMSMGLGYEYIITELLHQPVTKRSSPPLGTDTLNEGNYLAFAIANRWVNDVDYVYTPNGGGDINVYFKENWTNKFPNDVVRLTALTQTQFESLKASSWHPDFKVPYGDEPRVPFRSQRWKDFKAAAGYDFLYLAKSPAFAPAELDPSTTRFGRASFKSGR